MESDALVRRRRSRDDQLCQMLVIGREVALSNDGSVKELLRLSDSQHALKAHPWHARRNDSPHTRAHREIAVLWVVEHINLAKIFDRLDVSSHLATAGDKVVDDDVVVQRSTQRRVEVRREARLIRSVKDVILQNNL